MKKIAFGLSLFPLLVSQLQAEEFRSWEGSYELSNSTTIHIETFEDGLVWRREGADPLPVLVDSPDSARVPDAGIELRFGGAGENRRLFARRYEETVPLPRAGAEAEAFSSDNLPSLFDTLTPRLMLAWDVPGVSIALVEGGEVTWLGQYGIKSVDGTDKVGPDTVFEAASMSKPFFAYLVMQLVQEGAFDLDKPLVEYLGKPYIENDPRHEKMTGRMTLSHSGGFPNWRPGGRAGGGPIPVRFEPGTDFSYSGEGYWFLQQTVEEVIGRPLDRMSDERLLQPLGMTRSSFVWKSEYDEIAAAGHDSNGQLPERPRSLFRNGNSAFTLYTTPEDYARFLIEMMRDDRSAPHSLNAATLEEMLTPIVVGTGRSPHQRSLDDYEGELFYGLGWRIEKVSSGKRYCHSGSNRNGFRCYSEFNPANGNGVVIMTNSYSGQHVWQELLRYIGEI